MSEQEASLRAPSASLPWWVQVCRWLWRALRWVWGTLIAGILVGVVVTLITASTNTSLSSLSLTRLVTTYRLSVSIGLAILLLLTLLSWVGSREEQAAPARSLSEQNRSHMLRRLHMLYEQLLTQSLQGATRVELGFVEQSAAVEQPLNLASRLPDQPDRPFPPHMSIVDVYTQTQQELLILGEPGAGKSTLLLVLAQYLVEQAEQDAKRPIPIRLPLSSWAVTRRRLDEWLGEEIARLYQVSPRLSQQWIAAEQVLPLLDGLDEMNETARPACIAAINTYHREHTLPLVVCSRASEYYAATRHAQLELGTAVVVQPLEAKQVDAYLERLGEPLAGLRTALQTTTLLQELAITPLLLQVLMLTYRGTPVHTLPQQEAQLREQIWTDYVQRMVRDKGNARRYSLSAITGSLKWLASEMRQHNQTIFSLEFLQPDWLPPRQRKRYRGSIRLVFGLLVGLVGGLLFGLVSGLLVGLVDGQPFVALILGPACGLFGGLLAWSMAIEADRQGSKQTNPGEYGFNLYLRRYKQFFGRTASVRPAERFTWSWKGFPRRLVIGLAGGLIFGLFFGGPVGALVFGLLGGLIAGFSREQLTERLTLAPNEGIHRSLKNGLLGGLVFGLLIWLIIGLGSGLFGGPVGGLLIGLAGGLVGGLIGGLAAALRHYTLRFWLARSGLFPWQAVPFLEDATARILLRRVGGGYSFAHRLLLDFFADANAPFFAQTTTALVQATNVREAPNGRA